jgi:hypothetical protein
MCKSRRRARPRPEVLEDRLAPAVQLTFGGPGSILGLHDLANGATPAVATFEPTPNLLRIDLGSKTFDGSSTSTATGLTYENAGSPATSHFATVDPSQPNNIATLQAALPGATVTLGPIADAAGGLGNVEVNAGFIVVTGLDTSQTAPGGSNVDLTAVGTLTVDQNSTLNTGTGTLTLAAGVNADATGSGAGGPVTVQDSVFTDPNVGNGVFVRNPPATPWTYTGSAGVSGNHSGFTGNNPNAPDGDQVAFLQQQSSMSQVINFAAGSYALSVLAAQRLGDPGVQTIQFQVDGMPVGAPVQPTGMCPTSKATRLAYSRRPLPRRAGWSSATPSRAKPPTSAALRAPASS